MRDVGNAIAICPRSGHGRHVFRPETRRLAALYNIPDEHVIVFDERKPSPARFSFVLGEIDRITRAMEPTGETIDTVFVLRHGYPKGGQEGEWTHNVDAMVDAFRGRLSDRVTWVYYSCSNAATIGRAPNGDLSLADAKRDSLCRHGHVWCRAWGHKKPGHATQQASDRDGSLCRYFDGEGRPEGGTGGVDLLPTGHRHMTLFRTEMRKSYDPDDDGPEPMTGLRFRVPFMETHELVSYLDGLAGGIATTGRTTSPTTRELQEALVRGGFDVGEIDGVQGRRTTAAVKAFQRAHPPLVVDGDAGPATWRQLRAAGLLA